MPDNWTKKLYKDEIKSIYKPKAEKTAGEEWQEFKEEVSLKNIKKGAKKSLKSTFKTILIAAIIVFVVLGLMYIGLMIYINIKTT